MPVDLELADGIARATLNDPPLNILTRDLLAELRGTLAELSGDPTLRVLVVGAAGKHFSAGASVEEHLPDQVGEMIPEFMETILAVDAFPLPVIVAVQGRCLGGALELALAGDLVLASEGALLGVPEIQLGVLPPAACVQLPALASPGVAAELVYTGAPIDAHSACAAGLVLRVVPEESLHEEATELAGRIAARSGAALRVAKKALRAGRGALDARMAGVAHIYLHELMATADATEGLTSFMEKRPPAWRHA